MKPNKKTITMDLEDYENIKEIEEFLSSNSELGTISDIKDSLLELHKEEACWIRGDYSQLSVELFPRQLRIRSKKSVLSEIKSTIEFSKPEFLKENQRLNKEVHALNEVVKALNGNTFINSKTIKRKGWFWK